MTKKQVLVTGFILLLSGCAAWEQAMKDYEHRESERIQVYMDCKYEGNCERYIANELRAYRAEARAQRHIDNGCMLFGKKYC